MSPYRDASPCPPDAPPRAEEHEGGWELVMALMMTFWALLDHVEHPSNKSNSPP